MNEIWDPYKNLLGPDVIEQLFQIANILKGAKIVHVNSTKEGGGVAEILMKMVPLMKGLGLDASWEVIEGNPDFFQCTKSFHNIFQSHGTHLPSAALLKSYEEVNQRNAEKLGPILKDADFVMIHDPQPISMIKHIPNRKGKWIWRCHIDTSSAPRFIWRYFHPFIDAYDASVFSLETFNQVFSHPVYIIAPSIDPFNEKNIELDKEEVSDIVKKLNIDPSRKIITQISRFDEFKDPIGIIHAYQLAKKYNTGMQLVLAGGGAADDPEGKMVFEKVIEEAGTDPDIHILNLPPSNRMINALQRASDIVLQKSIKEGFGLTVTEALWKAKPVIGGNTGGIRIQILDHYTGLLVNSPEGAANRIRYLLQSPDLGAKLGIAGKQLVKDNYLITRHLRSYLTMMTTLKTPNGNRIDLSGTG